ncbi:P-loop containing nucleoside triphosphate hydrolase protein [Apiospora saccharicola]
MPPYSLSNGGGGLLRLRSIFEQTTPGFATLQDFFLRWLNLDVTTIAVAITAFGAISTGTSQLRYVAGHIYRWVTRLFTASVSISGNDRLNREVLNWIGAKVLLHQETRILTARSEITQNDAWDFRRIHMKRNDQRHGGKRLPIQYLPTFGITWFIHERNVFLVRRIPEGRVPMPGGGSTPLGFDSPDQYVVAPAGHEPLVVMCLGRSVAPIKRFLETCREFADKQRESFITVRTMGQSHYRESWDNTILRPLRPLDTVHMDKKVKDDLVNDISNYLNPATRRFYTTRGIPYRRGYLLYGPPGTGKTSLSLALAGMFGLELYIVHVPTLGSDSELERMFTALPPKCIVLLEDIDAVGVKRQASDETKTKEKQAQPAWVDEMDAFAKGRTRCSLSGLLNVLDGVTSQEGRIVLMTANMADNLDEALVRPGRIDKKIFMGRIDRDAAEEMFLRMFEPDREQEPNVAETCAPAAINMEELKKLAARFSTRIPRGVFTPAQLQGFLLNHRGQPEVAVAKVEEWTTAEEKRMKEALEQEKVAAKQKMKKNEEKADAKVTQVADKLAAVLGNKLTQYPSTNLQSKDMTAFIANALPRRPGSSDSPVAAAPTTNGEHVGADATTATDSSSRDQKRSEGAGQVDSALN